MNGLYGVYIQKPIIFMIFIAISNDINEKQHPASILDEKQVTDISSYLLRKIKISSTW